MPSFELVRNELAVTGELGPDDMDLLVREGHGLLGALGAMGAEGTEAVLDMRGASPSGSAFVGAVAQIAMEARTRSKALVVRATGRTADWLVWAGLHRIARLDVCGTRRAAQA